MAKAGWQCWALGVCLHTGPWAWFASAGSALFPFYTGPVQRCGLGRRDWLWRADEDSWVRAVQEAASPCWRLSGPMCAELTCSVSGSLWGSFWASSHSVSRAALWDVGCYLEDGLGCRNTASAVTIGRAGLVSGGHPRPWLLLPRSSAILDMWFPLMTWGGCSSSAAIFTFFFFFNHQEVWEGGGGQILFSRAWPWKFLHPVHPASVP